LPPLVVILYPPPLFDIPAVADVEDPALAALPLEFHPASAFALAEAEADALASLFPAAAELVDADDDDEEEEEDEDDDHSDGEDDDHAVDEDEDHAYDADPLDPADDPLPGGVTDPLPEICGHLTVSSARLFERKFIEPALISSCFAAPCATRERDAKKTNSKAFMMGEHRVTASILKKYLL